MTVSVYWQCCMQTPGVEDHRQGERSDAFSCSGASCAHNSAPLGFQLYSQGFGNAAKEHVQNAKLVPVTLFSGVNDITNVGWWQGLHPNDASETNRCHFWKNPSQQGGHLKQQRGTIVHHASYGGKSERNKNPKYGCKQIVGIQQQS